MSNRIRQSGSQTNNIDLYKKITGEGRGTEEDCNDENEEVFCVEDFEKDKLSASCARWRGL